MAGNHISQAEGLGNLLKNTGRTSAKSVKKLATNLGKNTRRSLRK